MTRFLLGVPDVARLELLAAHAPDADGRCTGCRSSCGATPRWPCTLRVLVEEACRIDEAAARRSFRPPPVCSVLDPPELGHGHDAPRRLLH